MATGVDVLGSEGVCEDESDGEVVSLGVALSEGDSVEVSLGAGLSEGVDVSVGAGVSDALGAGDGSLGVSVGVSLGEGDSVGVGSDEATCAIATDVCPRIDTSIATGRRTEKNFLRRRVRVEDDLCLITVTPVCGPSAARTTGGCVDPPSQLVACPPGGLVALKGVTLTVGLLRSDQTFGSKCDVRKACRVRGDSQIPLYEVGIDNRSGPAARGDEDCSEDRDHPQDDHDRDDLRPRLTALVPVRHPMAP
jgi:hypothetical protein